MTKQKASRILCGIYTTLISTTLIAAPASDDGIELCKELQINGNQHGVPKSRFQENLARMTRPTGEALSPELSAGLYLAFYGDGRKLGRTTWKTLKPTIDAIYAGEIKFKISEFDINNDKQNERVLIFNGQQPFNVETAYVIDENNLPNSQFKSDSGLPAIIYGVNVIYLDQTYQLSYRYKSKTGTLILTSVVVYKPAPLNEAPRIIPLGAGAICTIKII
ncbi:hypothetical protein [Pseudomonas pseudonitroreducens]|uniref:hypothetical protein n=1 Tax=Pseudomonas pseudonitroreducens TaxID=2892326 RepID=UPI001F20144F|nr:hypothetical protein [Pseudomonas pseudonitroreducens]